LLRHIQTEAILCLVAIVSLLFHSIARLSQACETELEETGKTFFPSLFVYSFRILFIISFVFVFLRFLKVQSVTKSSFQYILTN